MSCTAVRGTEFGHAPGHNQSSNTGTQPTGFRVVQICQTERDEAVGYDALKKCGMRKAKRKASAKTAKRKERRNIRHVEHEMLLLQGKGLSQVPDMACREENNDP